MLHKYILLLVSFLLVNQLIAQEKFILSGKVKDKNGEVLPGAAVYISGFKIATSTK